MVEFTVSDFLNENLRIMSRCAYFERKEESRRSTLGWYKRDGKKCKVLSWWTNADITGDNSLNQLPNKQERQWASLLRFKAFLDANGWLNSGWYKSREFGDIEDDEAPWWLHRPPKEERSGGG